MRTPDGWSLGVYIGLPVAVFFVVVCLVIIAGSVYFAKTGDEETGCAGIIVGTVGLAVTLAITGFTYWPWGSQWHRWYKVDGQVQAIGNRQISDGNAMSMRYVFRIAGEDYGVDDTRATLVKVGDTVHLKCKRDWVYNSQSGWVCNWNGSGE